MHKLTTQPAALAIEIGHASWTRDPGWMTHRTRRLIAPASRLAGGPRAWGGLGFPAV